MALVETESIVLKTYNLAEADKIVVLLTQDHGVVRGVAKGAKRLKSRFGSGLEPFSLVRVTYFQKDAVELVSIDKIDLIRSNFREASIPEFLQKFSFLGDALIALSPPHDPNETLYRMVRASIEAAGRGAAELASVAVYFELWLLKLSGFLPDWTACVDCRRKLDTSEDAAFTSDFHLLCSGCRKHHGGREFTAATREMLPLAMRNAPAAFASATLDSRTEVDALSVILRRMISTSIGRELPAEISLQVPR